LKCFRQFSELTIDNPDGRITPCCWFDISKNDQWYQYNNIFNDTKTNYYFWSDIQDRMENGWIDECHLCEKLERENQSSMRTEYDFFDKNKVKSIHISLDFTCNMMCRTCQPNLSSKWAADKQFLDELQKIDYNHYNYRVKEKNYFENLKIYLNSLDLSNIENIVIVGGEPFISKNLKWFLRLFKNPKKIKIMIDTNGSIIPDNETLKILNNFLNVQLNVSVDATENLFEVLRYGVKWKIIKNNILKFKNILNNLNLNITTVISIMNVNFLNSIVDFKNSISEDIKINPIELYWPNHLIHYQIPLSYRKNWITGDQKIDDKILTNKRTKNEFQKFIKFTKMLDEKHNNSFRECNPVIWRIVNENKF